MNHRTTLKSILKILTLVFIFFLLKTSCLFSQNITGTWEGIMADEFLRINIIQDGKELCGYTSDFVINDRNNKCKVYFKGLYDKKKKTWIITGTKFIENSGNHVLMTLKLWGSDNSNLLNGAVSTELFMVEPENLLYNAYFTVRKVSNEPLELSGNRPTCYDMPKREAPPSDNSAVKKEKQKKEKKEKKKKDVEENTTEETKKETETTTVVVTDVPKNDNSINEEELTTKMKERKNNEISRLEINEPEIELSVYDNGIVDNDTVSIFYNGKLIKSKQRLSEEPLKIKLKLDENTTQHEIIMFAENLGSIPPNTAIIIVNAGSKRYELRSSASLEENAVLYLEYKP